MRTVCISILFMLFNFHLLGAESVISGTSENIGETISFTFPTDHISGSEISFPTIVKSDGSFSITLDVDEPLYGRATGSDWEAYVYIYPSDTLLFQVAGSVTSFRGKHGAENQFLNKLKSNQVSHRDILYQMTDQDIDAYQAWLSSEFNQRKSEFLSFKSGQKLSDSFETFINAELSYDHAYYLMRYRIEHPIANDMVPPIALPQVYLKELSDVLINNANAINSPAYQRYLSEYIAMSREVQSEVQQILVEDNYKIVSKTAPVFAQPDIPPIYQSLDKGSVVKFLGERSDFKTKSRIGGEMSEDYWYKVRLYNGTEGWVLGHTIEKVEKATSQNEDPIKREVTTISKVVTKAIAIYDNIEILNDPHERKVVMKVPYGTEMDYPLVSTTENHPYKFQGVNRLGKFTMVDIGGTIGWVFESLVKTQRKVVQITEQRQIVTLAALGDYSTLDRFLVECPLYYYIAKDLHHRMQFNQDENLKRDIENFLNISDNTSINNYIRYQYNDLFTTEIDFNLTKEDIQLVNLISKDDAAAEGLIVNNYAIDNDIEVYQNYVVIPEIESSTNTYETRITLDEPSLLDIVVSTDPLRGGFASLRSYARDRSNNTIAYDQAENEFANLKFGNISRKIYLTAGTDLKISLGQNNQVVFEDDVNQFMNAFYENFHKRDQSILQRIRTASEIEFKTFVSSLAKQKLTFLKELAKKNKLDDEFVKDMTYDINYWMAHQLLRFTAERPKYDKSWVLPKEEVNYYDFLSQIDINPVNRTLGANYRNFISAYLTYYHGLIENRNIPTKSLIEDRFNGYSYYYLMAQELYEEVFKVDPVHAGKAIAGYVQTNPYTDLSQSLVTVYNANLPLRAGVQAPYFELKDRSGRVVRQTDLIGKIVVLDFWATWCAPCLEKLRTDREIWDKYSEEDVVFLYVSLDNNESTWKKFLSMNTMIKGEHAIPSGQNIAFDSPIAKTYKVSSIPAFFIIGKDGNLAYNPFTTLSPLRIRDHIDNLLYPR